MKVKLLLSLILLALLSSCSPKIIAPAQSDVDRVSKEHPDYTLESLNEGRTNFMNYCGKCHPLKSPASRTESQWKEIVPAMVEKASKRSITIDAETEQAILEYLITMSKQEQ